MGTTKLLCIMMMVAVCRSYTFQRSTIITTKPEDLKVAAGSPATFRCTPSDTDPVITPEVTWEFKGSPIDFKDSRVLMLNDYSLYISATVAHDSGSYVCVVKTPVDEARAQALLRVQDKPNPPALDGIECKENYAVIRWHSSGDNGAYIHHFNLQYRTSFSPDYWELGNEAPGMETSWNVRLNPGGNYKFRVIAHNDIGSSAPSDSSEVCSTPPDVPYSNPVGVRGRGTRPDNMVIFWTIMPQEEHNGPGFHYKVSYRRDGPGEVWVDHVITDWRQSELLVPDTATFTRYLIKVTAVNPKGPSRDPPTEVVGWSGEDTPLLAPTNFTLQEIFSSDYAVFNWDHVPVESLRGHFHGYKIQVWTNDTEIKEYVCHRSSKAAFVTVEPFKTNYARIMVYNGAANGPPSETISFLTPQGTPGPVKSFNAFPLGDTAMILNWEKPEAEHGILIGYKVYYAKVVGTEVGSTLKRRTIDATSTVAKLSGLHPGTKYRIWIRALTEAGEGREFVVEQTTTDEGAALPDPPRFEASMLCDKCDKVDMFVRWRPALDGHPGTQFQVSYRPKGHSQWTQRMETDDDYVVITDLEPRVYEVKVTSYDGDYSKDSEIKKVNLSGQNQRWAKFIRMTNNE